METTRKYTIGNAELVAEIFEGEVLQLDEVGTTHVHGHGGGGVVSNGEGYVSDVHISSHTSWKTKVWVKCNGKEVQWGIPGSLAFRPGHKIAVCKLSDGKNCLTCFVKNVTTQTEWVLTGVNGHNMFRTFDINNIWLHGSGSLILAVLSILTLLFNLVTAFQVPAFAILFIGLIVCTLLSYRSLFERRRKIIEEITNMINDIKKIMPST